MLIAHGTHEYQADVIEKAGHFNQDTYFLSLRDPKLSMLTAASYSFQNHPRGESFVDLVCRQDLLLSPPLFRDSLKKSVTGQYHENKALAREHFGDGEFQLNGLIYILDVPPDSLYLPPKLHSMISPLSVRAKEEIPTSRTVKILTLDEQVEEFQAKYDPPVDPLDDIDIDSL